MTRNNLIPPSPTSDEYRQANNIGAQSDPASQNNPFALFEEWMGEARSHEPNDPNAMALSTVDSDGMPDVRMVLLKDVDPDGFVFYTNLESAKGRQLASHPKAALCFHWKSLRRQVRVRGHIEPVSKEEADAYFATRARDSRIGAWASAQSRPLEDAFALEKKVAAYALKFGVGEVPRPDFWSGFRLVPLRIEFWRDKMFRLHDRTVFERENSRADWSIVKLYP